MKKISPLFIYPIIYFNLVIGSYIINCVPALATRAFFRSVHIYLQEASIFLAFEHVLTFKHYEKQQVHLVFSFI